jgi:hypothetical protein
MLRVWSSELLIHIKNNKGGIVMHQKKILTSLTVMLFVISLNLNCFAEISTDELAKASEAKAVATSSDPLTTELIEKKVNEACELLGQKGKAAFPSFQGQDSNFIFAGTYIWIHDQNGVMRMHPIKYKLNGKNLINLTDSTGKLFFAVMNEDFIKVSESASKVGDLVGEISAASKEQAEGIDQLNRAVIEMDKVVQQNAANAEESASSAAEMSSQATSMKRYVGDLVALVPSDRKNQTNEPPGQTRKPESKHIKNPGLKRVNSFVPNKEAGPQKSIPLDDEDFKDF